MLPDKLNDLKSYLEGKGILKKSEKELLDELSFIDENFLIQEELKEKYTEIKLFESFAMAPSHCPTCGKPL